MSYTDTGLSPSTSYCYQVKASNSGGTSFSNIACGKTQSSPGVKAWQLWNCSSGSAAGTRAVWVWDATVGGWTEAGSEGPQWSTYGLCGPSYGGTPVTATLPDRHVVLVEVVAPDSCSTGDDPTNYACVTWSWHGLGSASGPTLQGTLL
jgi:hypothetical protein